MGFSTFSGPLRSGTKRNGDNNTMGLAVLARSYDTGDLTGAETGNLDAFAFSLPQGAQIVDIVVDQTVAAGTGETEVSVGTEEGGAELMAAVDTSAGGRFRGTATASTQAAWQTSTSDDTDVYVRVAVSVGTLTAGRAVVTVLYVQRAKDGSQAPSQG